MVFRGLTSSSLDMYRASHYAVQYGNGGVLFRLDGWSARNIQGFSLYPDEEEVLFQPGSRFIVCDVAKWNSFEYKMAENAPWETKSFYLIRLVEEDQLPEVAA